MSLAMKRNSRSGLVACMKDRRSETVRDAFNDFKIDRAESGCSTRTELVSS